MARASSFSLGYKTAKWYMPVVFCTRRAAGASVRRSRTSAGVPSAGLSSLPPVEHKAQPLRVKSYLAIQAGNRQVNVAQPGRRGNRQYVALDEGTLIASIIVLTFSPPAAARRPSDLATNAATANSTTLLMILGFPRRMA